MYSCQEYNVDRLLSQQAFLLLLDELWLFQRPTIFPYENVLLLVQLLLGAECHYPSHCRPSTRLWRLLVVGEVRHAPRPTRPFQPGSLPVHSLCKLLYSMYYVVDLLEIFTEAARAALRRCGVAA